MAKKTKASKMQLGAGIQAVLGGRRPAVKTPKEEMDLVKELSNTVASIDITKIERNLDQPRTVFEDDALEELSSSIKQHGIIQPITVRSMGDGTFQIISGERRWRASKKAGLKEIPAYVRTANDQELLEMALVENIQREDLNPLEMAISLERLKESYKLTNAEVGTKIGKKGNTVSGYLSALTLSANIQESLRDGDISMGHAKALASLDKKDTQAEFYTRLVDNDWSVRALENAIKDYKDQEGIQKPKAAKADGLPSEYEVIQQTLRKKFGSKKVSIKLKKDGKGQILLPFNSTEEFNSFLDILEGE